MPFTEMMVHVVIGSDGEYSDRHEWVAGVFTDLEVAKQHVIELTAAGRQRAIERQAWMSNRIDLTKKKRESKITPDMIQYYGAKNVPYVALTKEDEEAIDDETGPLPPYIRYDSYYIVAVPINKWGKWSEYEMSEEGESERASSW